MNPFSKPQKNANTNQPDLALQGENLEPQDENQTSTEKSPSTAPSKVGQAGQAKRKLPLPKILVAGIIILITLLTFVLIAYLVMGQTKSQIVNDNSLILNEAPTPTPDPTADWETYEGDGFSIKYPSYLKFQDLVNHEDGWTLTLNDKEENNVMGNTINNSLIISYDPIPTQVYSNSPITDINQVWEGDDEKEFYQIQGHEAVKIISKSVALDNGTKISNIYLYVLKDDNLWIINTSGKEELDQILSTFKFTNAETTMDTSEWNVFEHLKYKYSIKYDINDKLISGRGLTDQESNWISIAARDKNQENYTGSLTIEVLDPKYTNQYIKGAPDFYKLDIDTFFNNIIVKKNPDNISNISNTELNGYNGKKFTAVNKFSDSQKAYSLNSEHTFILLYDPNNIKFMISYPSSNEHLKEVLSTFKFTE